MTSEQIKKECEEIIDTFAKLHSRLDELKIICKHEETKLANYSWRPGCIDEVTMCSFCSKIIKDIFNG